MKHAFTLVELAIVLVILGLLVGGILAGQNLIRSSELRALTTQVKEYEVAFRTFQSKYMALPGDMSSAFGYWGTACAATEALCNGNGDGRVYANGTTDYQEYYRAWQHLSLTGLIAGDYTGVQDASGNCVFGLNVPEAQGVDGGIVLARDPFVSGDQTAFFQVGPRNNVDHGGCADHTALTPPEMYSIDKKIDDGLPQTGRVYGNNSGGGITTVCINATTFEYELSSSDPECRAYFRAMN